MGTPNATPVFKSPTVLGLSKTSVQGVLSLLIVIGLQLSAIQLPSTLATPNLSHALLWTTFIATTVVGILKAVLALSQGDATNQ
jgi:hypothetical protein